MSELVNPEPPADDEANASAGHAPASPPLPKKKGRWWRRLRITVLLMLFLLFSSRIIVVLLLPPVLHHVAGYYGLDATYQRLELSLLSGDTGLWHLVISPKTGGEAIAVVDYCRGDISPLNLLRGRLVVWRVEADGVNVALARNADGTVPLLKLLARNSPTSPTPTPAAAAAKTPGRIDLTPPLQLDALRLSHIKLHLRDQAVTPALDSVVGVDVRLSDLGGSSGRPTNFSADVDADPFLDALHLTGQGQTHDGTLDATFAADVNGLRLRPLSPYLALLGVRPLANETTLHAGGQLTLGPSAQNPSVAAAVLKLANIELLADGEEAAAVGQLALEAPSLDPHRLGLKSLVLQNVRLSGRRSSGGNLRFAGLGYVGIPKAVASSAPSSPKTPPAALPILDLPLVDLHNVAAQFNDDAVTPSAHLTLQLDQLQVKHLLLDPARPDATVGVTALAHLPGLAGDVHLDGSVQPSAVTKSLALTVAADGVALNAVQPYLEPLGIRSTIRNGTFSASIRATATPAADGVDLSAAVTDVLLKQEATLLAMNHLRVDHAHLGHTLSVDDISIGGPSLAIQRAADGTLDAAGLQFDPGRLRQSAPARPAAAAPTTGPATPVLPRIPAMPALAIKHFRWDGIDVSYDDDSLVPPLHTRVADAGVDYQDARFSAWAKMPQVVEQLAVDGSVAGTPQTLAANLKLSAAGINSSLTAPFLEPFHVQPTLRDGAIRATADATLRLPGQAIDGSLHLSDVTYLEGSQELAGVDRVAVDAVHLTPQGLSVGQVRIDRPRATVTRERSGAFVAAGVRVLPAAWATSTPPQHAPAVATTRPITVAAPFPVALDRFSLAGGSLRWIDQQKSVDTTASAELELSHLALGGGSAGPATVAFKTGVVGVVDSASVDGTLRVDPASPEVDLSIQATNLRAGPLAAYLPGNLSVPLHDGTFRTRVQAGGAAAPGGGVSGQFIATDLDFRQSGDPAPLLKFDAVRLIARRVDPAAHVFQLGELSTAGVELSAQRSVDGGVGALGVQLHPSAAEPTETDNAVPAADLMTPVAPESVQSLLAAASPRPLRLQLDQLDLNLRRITLLDEQRPAAAPLLIQNAELKNLDRIDWGGSDPDAKPPTHFRLSGALHPAVDNLIVNATVTPLAVQPTASLDLLATGIVGSGMTALLPELKPKVNASALTAGEFHLRMDASARLSRRGATQIDYAGPIEADVDLKPITFRAAPGGPILAGLDELHSDGIHFEPMNGSLHVKTLELTNPIGRVTREADGLHVLGVVLPNASPAAAAAVAVAPSTQPTAAPLRNPTTAPALRPARPSAEIRVDQLVISDLDFVAEDRTVDPPLVIPLTGADVEVRGFTNLAPYEDRPLKFSGIVNAGKVTLPRPLSSSGLGGALGDAAKLLAGRRVATHRAMEQRELFAEASANGSIGLYPAPNGYLKTNLGGFELASLTSTAALYGVSLSDGVFDTAINATLPGDGSIQTQSRFVITDLGISEPPNGPIFRYLHLPAPLDAVVGVLQDQEGSITVPLDVPMRNANLSAAALAGPAVSAFGSIVATAIASTPFKAASGLTDLLGMGGRKTAAPEPPVLLAFDPGDVTLTPADAVALSQLRARMIQDPTLTVVIKHTLGGGDVADAQMRANPSPLVAQQLAQQMRQQQLASAQLRSDLAGVVRSDLERGTGAQPRIEQLRQVNQQMAQTDDAMDRLFELMRPGADRLAARRTRAVCLDYGKQRLQSIRSALTDEAPANLADRIHLLSPQYSQPADDAGGTVLVQLVPKL